VTELDEVVQELVRDLETVGLDRDFALYDLASREWIHRGDGVAQDPPSGFGSKGRVAVLLGSQRLVADDEQPISPRSTLEMVSFVQDCVTDEVGFGWPEYRPGGRYRGVLAPTAVAAAVWWSLDGDPLHPLGALPSLPRGTIKVEA
jgi:hypothetical protein